MAKSLTIFQLAERCQAESVRYKQSGRSDESYCLELFRKALTEQDGAAWDAIYAQYQLLVATWIQSYSRFTATGEEADFFVNEAFFRMWKRASESETFEKLDSLGKYLIYLKLCARSAIEDFLRRKTKDALAAAVPWEDFDRPAPAADAQLELASMLRELGRVLDEVIQDDRERLVAEESWVYGLSPRQIQARRPEIFGSVAEVNPVKRNIIRRLKRHPGLGNVGEWWAKSG